MLLQKCTNLLAFSNPEQLKHRTLSNRLRERQVQESASSSFHFSCPKYLQLPVALIL